jgi:hypothetical protein
MNPENHSSKWEEEVKKETEELKKRVDNLQRMLDMTLEHQKRNLLQPKGHPQTFGKYTMM